MKEMTKSLCAEIVDLCFVLIVCRNNIVVSSVPMAFRVLSTINGWRFDLIWVFLSS